ncbi:MAG: NAD(P)-dependent oxidoreductase [Pseudomonadota bacterium]
MRVGVAGCGEMGLPMAEALADGGFDLLGYDLKSLAAPFMADRAAFWAHAELAFSIVRDIPETEALLFGEIPLVEAPNLRVLAICSTLAPSYVRSLRARVPPEITLLDTPMSGAPVGARERRLTFMVGGEPAEVDRIRPMLDAMGSRVMHLGPLGAGMTAKVLNNLIAASSVAATRTALAWGQAAGLEPDTLRALFEVSSGHSWVSANWDQIEWFQEGYDPANTMGILVKDLESARDAAPDGASDALAQTLIDVLRDLSPDA